MTDKPEPYDGDIWLHDKRTYYRLSNFEGTRCKITRVIPQGDEWIDNPGGDNSRYDCANFKNSFWQFHISASTLAECPECNEEKRISKDDFLCPECRKRMPVNCRLVADVNDEGAIVVLSGTEDKIELLRDGSVLVSLKREDLPEVAITTLKKFLE